MTAKRYFKREWEVEYYIFDSQTISEKEFDEKFEYEDYIAFEDSMQGDEVLNRLNELYEENNLLKDIIKDIVVQLDANHTSHTYQMTIPINKVIYNELKRRLKGISFNEELRRFFE